MTCWRDAVCSKQWVCTGVCGGVCVCARMRACVRILHIGHTEQRVCGSGGAAFQGQRSENGHPGDLDQAVREGRLTVFLKSFRRLWSTEPFSRSSTLLIRPLRTITDVFFSLEGGKL